MRDLVVLYASQTGTACEVAHQIGRLGRNRLLETKVLALDSYPIEQLPECPLAIFVAATTGDGEIPDNMTRFWKFLLRKSLPSDSLEDLKYSIFGLGDSTYPKFNAVARRLDARLQQLGATALSPKGLGDDQHEFGYSAALDPFLRDLWSKVLELYPLPENFVLDDSPKLDPPKYRLTWSSLPESTPKYDPGFYVPPHKAHEPERGPIEATLVQNERMTALDWQ